MRLVFAGTPGFVTPILDAIEHMDAHDLIAIYTVADAKSGRGRKQTASPVKHWAIHHGFSIEQPVYWNEHDVETLATYKPDLMIIMAYRMLLADVVLKEPQFGCINLHTSLLPRWRGAAPVIRAIEHGDEITGVSLMQMEAKMDTGHIISCRGCRINNKDTALSIYPRLTALGIELLEDFLSDVEAKLQHARRQPETGICYAHKPDKHEARIDWYRDVQTIEQKIRAFNPSPVAYTMLGNNRLRLCEAEVQQQAIAIKSPGTIISLENGGLNVCCGEGVISLRSVQPASGRVMSATDFANGYDAINKILH